MVTSQRPRKAIQKRSLNCFSTAYILLFCWECTVCAMVKQPLKSQYSYAPFCHFFLVLFSPYFVVVHFRNDDFELCKQPSRNPHSIQLWLIQPKTKRSWIIIIVCCGFGCLVILFKSFAYSDLLIGSRWFLCFSFSTTLLPFIEQCQWAGLI